MIVFTCISIDFLFAITLLRGFYKPILFLIQNISLLCFWQIYWRGSFLFSLAQYVFRRDYPALYHEHICIPKGILRFTLFLIQRYIMLLSKKCFIWLLKLEDWNTVIRCLALANQEILVDKTRTLHHSVLYPRQGATSYLSFIASLRHKHNHLLSTSRQLPLPTACQGKHGISHFHSSIPLWLSCTISFLPNGFPSLLALLPSFNDTPLHCLCPLSKEYHISTQPRKSATLPIRPESKLDTTHKSFTSFFRFPSSGCAQELHIRLSHTNNSTYSLSKLTNVNTPTQLSSPGKSILY